MITINKTGSDLRIVTVIENLSHRLTRLLLRLPVTVLLLLTLRPILRNCHRLAHVVMRNRVRLRVLSVVAEAVASALGLSHHFLLVALLQGNQRLVARLGSDLLDADLGGRDYLLLLELQAGLQDAGDAAQFRVHPLLQHFVVTHYLLIRGLFVAGGFVQILRVRRYPHFCQF